MIFALHWDQLAAFQIEQAPGSVTQAFCYPAPTKSMTIHVRYYMVIFLCLSTAFTHTTLALRRLFHGRITKPVFHFGFFLVLRFCYPLFPLFTPLPVARRFLSVLPRLFCFIRPGTLTPDFSDPTFKGAASPALQIPVSISSDGSDELLQPGHLLSTFVFLLLLLCYISDVVA